MTRLRRKKREAGREMKIDWVERAFELYVDVGCFLPSTIGGLLFLPRHGRSLEDHGN